MMKTRCEVPLTADRFDLSANGVDSVVIQATARNPDGSVLVGAEIFWSLLTRGFSGGQALREVHLNHLDFRVDFDPAPLRPPAHLDLRARNAEFSGVKANRSGRAIDSQLKRDISPKRAAAIRIENDVHGDAFRAHSCR